MAQHQQSPSSSLIPIRVDVFSDDNNVRIVDTILVDTTVWPVPLHAPYGESLDANAWYMAQSVLGDAEVVGMGRTVRHFTGRLELWSWSMLEKIHDCILPQLEVALYGTNKLTGTIRKPVAINRKASGEESSENPPAAKKIKRETAADATTGGSQGSSAEALAPPNSTQSAAETASSTDTTQKPPSGGETKHQHKVDGSSTQTDSPKKTVSSKKKSSSNYSRLIPIRIRMLVHGIRIHDDLWWDPSMSEVVSPITLAQSIGDDLKLAPDAVQAIVLSIVEQIHGLVLLPDETPEPDEGGPPGNRSKTTAAWPLEQRVHVTNVAHLVAQHRPPSSSSATPVANAKNSSGSTAPAK